MKGGLIPPKERGKSVTMYRVLMVSWGGTRRVLWDDMTYKDALRFCEDNGWLYCPDGGYEWDLEIEEV